jgi:hypothetical protein
MLCLEKVPTWIKKPLKQGKLNFSWLVVCNINLGVFQPRGKHYFSVLAEVLGSSSQEHRLVFTTEALGQQGTSVVSVFDL